MERGMVLGRKEIYGYNIVTDEFGEQHFEIIPEEAYMATVQDYSD